MRHFLKIAADTTFVVVTVYLAIATLYSFAFVFAPWPEMINNLWRFVFALVGIALFVATCVMFIATRWSHHFTGRYPLAFGGLAVFGIALAGWMIAIGPYAHISLSTVEIANDSKVTVDIVVIACPGDKRELSNLQPGQRKTVAVLPNNEGPLTIDFVVAGQVFASAETFVLECCGERFHCSIGPDGSASFVNR
jgi:hypothetical protein